MPFTGTTPPPPPGATPIGAAQTSPNFNLGNSQPFGGSQQLGGFQGPSLPGLQPPNVPGGFGTAPNNVLGNLMKPQGQMTLGKFLAMLRRR